MGFLLLVNILAKVELNCTNHVLFIISFMQIQLTLLIFVFLCIFVIGHTVLNTIMSFKFATFFGVTKFAYFLRFKELIVARKDITDL